MSLRRDMVFSLGGFDADALAFITAAAITNGTQKNAINYLVKGLKANSLWTPMKCIYPFIGGTATTHKYNLKNTATFQITFNGTVTHNSNGITPNGTTGYGNTFYIPSSNLTLNSESYGLYSRDSAALGVAGTATDMGCNGSTATVRHLLNIRAATGTVDYTNVQLNDVANGISTTTTDGSGLHIASRTSSTNLMRIRNGSILASNTTANTGSLDTLHPMYIGCRNSNGTAAGFVARNFAFAFMASGLTAAQTLVLYNIIQQYQTILGRQV